MNVKTLTGPSIHALLAEARALFGDDVVLLESVPAQGDQLARITVMADQPSPKAEAAVPRQAPAPPKPAKAPQPRPALAMVEDSPSAGEHLEARPSGPGFGYRATPRPTEDAAPRTERFSRPAGPVENAPRRMSTAPRRVPRDPGRGRLFEAPAPTGAATQALGDLVSAKLARMEERLEAFEHRLGNAFVGMSQRWMTLPLYGQLLATGLRTSTLTRLFDQLSREGFEPEDDPTRLQWAVAHALRERLNLPSPKVCAETQLFIGPSGAGKTALQLKLAKHPRFLGRHRPTVIVIAPEEGTDLSHQCPVELYRRFDLSVQTVATPGEMQTALQRAQQFSHILIDTPSMPLRLPEAQRFLARLRDFTAQIAPLQVHLVLNTARVLDGLTPAFLERLPLRPETLALTHLDEVDDLGRVAECLMKLKLPVQFTTDGPQVFDQIKSYSPTWLVETMLGMSIVERNPSASAWTML